MSNRCSPEALELLTQIQEAAFSSVPPFFAKSPSIELAEMLTDWLISQDGLSGFGIEPDQANALGKSFVKHLKDTQVLTPFESVVHYALIQSLIRRLEADGEPIPNRPIFGTVRTGRLNAMVVAVPKTKEYIVLLDDGMFFFANLMTDVIARTFVAEQPGDKHDTGIGFSLSSEGVQNAIKQDPIILKQFVAFLEACVIAGDPRYAMLLSEGGPHLHLVNLLKRFGGPHQQLINLLKESMNLFIIGHECGHVILGDFEKGKRVHTAFHELSVEEVRQDWVDEYAADLAGCTMMMAAEKNNAFIAFAGAVFCFSCMQIIERCTSTLRTGRYQEDTNRPGTHPPNSARRECLQYWLNESFPKERVAGAVSLSNSMHGAIEMLWQETESHWIRLHKRGVRPAFFWRQDC